MPQTHRHHGRPVNIPLDRISKNPGPCGMSFGFDLAPLRESIRKIGLLNRPLITQDPLGKVTVVTGYRRLMALKGLGHRQAPCSDLSASDLSALELLLINLHDNLATRPFNDVEKGMILSRLISRIPEEEILNRYMHLLGLPSREETLQTMTALETLDHEIRSALVSKHLSLQSVKTLLDLDRPSRIEIFGWIIELKLNFNYQIQFIETIIDLSFKEEATVPQILGSDSLCKILKHPKLDTPQKAAKILASLKGRRYPLLTKAENTFQKMMSGLDLPKGITINHPTFFEGQGMKLEIRFRDGKDLQEKMGRLSQMDGLFSINDPLHESRE